MRYVAIFLFSSFFALEAQGQTVHSTKMFNKLNRPSSETISEPTVICHHDHKTIREYVAKELTKIPYSTKSNSTLKITYDPQASFSQELIDAFELGTVPLITEFFSSTVPINVAVTDLNNGNPGTLAAAAPGTRLRFINNAPCLDCWYPISLAEKLIGEEFNSPDDPDILIFINTEASFYFDFQNPEGIGNEFDFVTIMFHEMLHAMGFTGFAGIDDNSNTGSISVDNSISAFDSYMVDLGGNLLSETLDNNSFRLASAFTNEALFWNAFRIGQIENRAILFAPRTFNPGSSLHHLDEDTYPTGPDALMTPFASRGQVLRSGGIATEMLYDMGWAIAQVDILLERDISEQLDEAVLLRAEVRSDIPYDTSSLALHISTDTFQTEIIIPMDPTEDLNIFSAFLEGTGVPQNIQYFVEVSDSRGVTRTTPSPAPEFFFSFQFVTDTEGPIILHDPITGLNEVDQITQLELSADITDQFGIGAANIEWQLNGGELFITPMTFNEDSDNPFAANEFVGTIEFGRTLVADDLIEYRIVSIDESLGQNSSTFPADGSFLSITVDAAIEPSNFYFNDFNTESNDFVGTGFSIRDEPNFTSSAIHSTHPYPEAGAGNSLNLTYELLVPIIIEPQRPVIEFDEVVLVEPGDPGTTFGQDEFWDFVVVEGRRLGTQEWIPFADGYDSTDNPTWLNAYLSDITGGTSNAVGRFGLFANRKINMIDEGNFALGDTVAVRFRLFSDPFAFGWGWSIDNLSIQDLSSAVSDFVDEQNFDVIPNPASDEVLVSLNLDDTAENMQINIVDITGRLIQERTLSNPSLRIREQIDISQLESGVYLVNVIFNNRDIITKKLIKQ